MNSLNIAIIGNPNVGKTTLFNAITGERQHVGNWPGVTVEKKEGTTSHQGIEMTFVDLPGTYSLTTRSEDEKVARDFLLDESLDIILQVVDSSRFERNLYLTTQLLEFEKPVVLALNKQDILEESGRELNRRKLESFLGVESVSIVAKDNLGVTELLDTLKSSLDNRHSHPHSIGFGGQTDGRIGEVVKILESSDELPAHLPLRWVATRLLEADEQTREMVEKTSVFSEINALLSQLDSEMIEIEMADARHNTIANITPQVLTGEKVERDMGDKLDTVLTHRLLGIPIFLSLMWLVFQLTFTAATPAMDLIDGFFASSATWLAESGGSSWWASLLGDGIISGVGFVLIFLPNIFILFFLLAILEESGYLARAAFLMDHSMHKLGLHGRSFIPMLMGFGCNVPAIMATRSIENWRDRFITITVIPFMSCAARLPVFILLAGAFFGAAAGTVIFYLYCLGILVAVLTAKLMRHSVMKSEPAPFILELPPYKMPTLKHALSHAGMNSKHYVKKAGGIILIGAILIWILASMPFGVEYGGGETWAASLGKVFEPLFAPLGFDWRIIVALIFGFVAKEVVVGALGVIFAVGGAGGATLTAAIQADPIFTPSVAFTLMVFTLLYTPCLATVGVIFKETKSAKWTAAIVCWGVVVAYLLALLTKWAFGIVG